MAPAKYIDTQTLEFDEQAREVAGVLRQVARHGRWIGRASL
jgi:hypothetical protein